MFIKGHFILQSLVGDVYLVQNKLISHVQEGYHTCVNINGTTQYGILARVETGGGLIIKIVTNLCMYMQQYNYSPVL